MDKPNIFSKSIKSRGRSRRGRRPAGGGASERMADEWLMSRERGFINHQPPKPNRWPA